MIAESQDLAAEMLEFLEGHGISAWIGSGWDEPAVAEQAADLDMLVTLGGDGSMLRAARMASQHGIPILGVNLGRLGFLAEVQPKEWPERLRQVLAGAGDRWRGLYVCPPTLTAAISPPTSPTGSSSPPPPALRLTHWPPVGPSCRLN
jgi:hypothetical protein